MHEEVKFIFKSLIKVPCIVVFSFLIFNIFTFFFMYFKALGLSYVVMQTTAENNYIPNQELTQLVEYIESWVDDIAYVADAGIIVGYEGDDAEPEYVLVSNESEVSSAIDTGNAFGDARNKLQYGCTRCVGVQVNYRIILPLVEGPDDVDEGHTEISHVEDIDTLEGIPITIAYKVPGLKYYPDMLTN